MKCQEDKNRQELKFSVGDWVYLKLQLFVQQSVAHRANRKLSFILWSLLGNSKSGASRL
jgi:hypothetical protein